MKRNGFAHKPAKVPAFVLRSERALRRAAKNVQTQNRALKLPVIVWQNGKVMEKPVKTSLCKCAAEHGISGEEAIKKGMTQKSKEFVEKGAEVYSKT